jgi:hypothetical protein
MADPKPTSKSNKKRRTETTDPTFALGQAVGAYFAIPEAFRSAFDISYCELVDKAATEAARREILKKHGLTSEQNIKSIRDQALRESIERAWKSARKLRQAWTQGVPPKYDFHVGDTLHTHDGSHIIQIDLVADPEIAATLYRRCETPEFRIQKLQTFVCTIQSFVFLLKHGRLPHGGLNLTDPADTDPTLNKPQLANKVAP